MAIIEVTATAMFSYDTEDGLVADADGALADAQSFFDNGQATAGSFHFTVKDSSAPSLEERPSTLCGCGFELVWVCGEWQHDVAPDIWGDDHDARPDEEPNEAQRKHWDVIDGVADEDEEED